MEPAIDGSIARVKGATKSEWLKVVRAEERSNLLCDLIKEGLGTNDIQNFVAGQVWGKGSVKSWEMDRENVVQLMKTKLENSVMDETEKRAKRNKMRARLERLMVKCKNQYEKFIHKVRDKVAKERRLLSRRNRKKVRAIRIKRKKEMRALMPIIIQMHAEARIFKEDGGGFVPGDVKGQVMWERMPPSCQRKRWLSLSLPRLFLC